nr:MAG TPA: hypothetical protein [Caudoviricetes sp.]
MSFFFSFHFLKNISFSSPFSFPLLKAIAKYERLRRYNLTGLSPVSCTVPVLSGGILIIICDSSVFLLRGTDILNAPVISFPAFSTFQAICSLVCLCQFTFLNFYVPAFHSASPSLLSISEKPFHAPGRRNSSAALPG